MPTVMPQSVFTVFTAKAWRVNIMGHPSSSILPILGFRVGREQHIPDSSHLSIKTHDTQRRTQNTRHHAHNTYISTHTPCTRHKNTTQTTLAQHTPSTHDTHTRTQHNYPSLLAWDLCFDSKHSQDHGRFGWVGALRCTWSIHQQSSPFFAKTCDTLAVDEILMDETCTLVI